MTPHEQILDYLDKSRPDATLEERALHVLMLAILANAPLRLKEPKGTYTKSVVISNASAQHEGKALDLRLVLYRTRRAEKAQSPFDAISLFLSMEGQHVQMSRALGGREPEEFVGLGWVHPEPTMVMASCPSLLLIVRRLPEALAELLKLQNQPTYRTGDVIRHIPSGEEWLVADVTNTHIGCCGWPHTLAPFSDVELVEAASDEAHIKLLREMANMSVPDPRRSYAQEMLEKMGQPAKENP